MNRRIHRTPSPKHPIPSKVFFFEPSPKSVDISRNPVIRLPTLLSPAACVLSSLNMSVNQLCSTTGSWTSSWMSLTLLLSLFYRGRNCAQKNLMTKEAKLPSESRFTPRSLLSLWFLFLFWCVFVRPTPESALLTTRLHSLLSGYCK